MKFLKNFRERYVHTNLFLAITSIVIAIVVWFFIAMTQYPSVQKTISHVTVSLDLTGSSAGQNGLQVISCDVEEVTVELLGSRTEVGNLSNDNLTAYFETDNVSSPGTKTLPLKIKGSGGHSFEVKTITPSKALVVFDKIETRDFPISPKAPNVELVDGKEIYEKEFACDPSYIQITGPSATLDKISKCYAFSKKNMTLSSSYVLTSDEIQLYTADNYLIDQENLKFSSRNFNISIPVQTQKTVKLKPSIINAPDSFDQNNIKFKLSADSVKLACNNDETEIPDTISFASIPLDEIKPGFSKTYSLSSCLDPTEFINISELEAVTVTIDEEGLEQFNMILDKSRINISNPPDSTYDYEVLTQQVSITVLGSAESLAEITQDDIYVEVNLLNAAITTDQFNWKATYSCPNYDDVWVVTNSRLAIQRTKKPPVTTEGISAFSNGPTTETTAT